MNGSDLAGAAAARIAGAIALAVIVGIVLGWLIS
jgi:F0F1-type ATP synthase assembly protein I